jgi:hypothetical protein
VEDIMPIATGHEREELEAELQVRWIVPWGLEISDGLPRSVLALGIGF